VGGGHVRRRSVEVSPCPWDEKRKQDSKPFDQYHHSPDVPQIVEKPSITSTSSYTFGGERMINAQRGLLEQQSLEESALIAEGEDLSGSCKCRAMDISD
jgi:serine/arginine repetitive matrix protein 2